MSILATILEAKRREVASRKVSHPVSMMVERRSPIRGFYEALAAPLPSHQRAAVIAEIKRASPSAGAIRADADPAEIALAYERAGASAISVLTDREFFDGRLEFLSLARSATEKTPLLRKDFIVDPYQVSESHAAGADALLLIVSALAGGALAELHACASEAGLGVLTEIHDEAEAERALAAGARVIGVNHRNLATFEIDLGLTERLAPQVPADVVLIAESGIRTSADVDRVRYAGAKGVLVGETLMRAAQPGQALTDLVMRS